MNEKHLIIISILVIIFIGYAGWKCGRYVNYKLQYEDMVLDTIRENVKSECLK